MQFLFLSLFLLLLELLCDNSQGNETVIGITISKLAYLSEVLQLYSSNHNRKYFHLCFDWQEANFLSSDTFFQHLLSQSIIIEQFKPSQNENILCGLSKAVEKRVDYLHLSAHKYGWSDSFNNASISVAELASQRNYPTEDNGYFLFIPKNVTTSFLSCCYSNSKVSKHLPFFPETTSRLSPTILSCYQQHGSLSTNTNEKLPLFPRLSLNESDNLKNSCSKDASHKNTARIASAKKEKKAFQQLQKQFLTKQHDHKLRDGACQLWWPWNHSEIFLHKPVPEAFQVLQVRTKTIVRCSTRSNHNHISSSEDEQSTPLLLLEITDCHDHSTTKNQTSCEQSSKSLFLLHNGVDDHQDTKLFEIESGLKIFSNSPPTKRHTLRIFTTNDKNQQNVISEFTVQQSIVYGGNANDRSADIGGESSADDNYEEETSTFCDEMDDRSSEDNPVFHEEKCLSTHASHSPFHPIATQLDSRDDLGFALSTLFASPPRRLSACAELSPSLQQTCLVSGRIWVEVGVQRGEYAELMLRTTTASELTTYVGIDSWRPWSEEEYVDIANHRDHNRPDDIGDKKNNQHDLYRQEAERRLSQLLNSEIEEMEQQQQQQPKRTDFPKSNFNQDSDQVEDITSFKTETTTNRHIYLVPQPSTVAAHLFADQSLDVVYIDAMHHYLAVLEDVLTWWPKVKPGGLLAGHDFLLSALDGHTVFTVKPAIQEIARTMNLPLLLTQEEEKPAFPTWMLFKPVHSVT